VPIITLGIVFVVVGFAFKVSAVPFHTWAPDTYEGAPTPVTAFLAVASKAAGFVALLQLVFVAFYGRDDVSSRSCGCWPPLTMTVGNLIALRQTNIVRLLAYSGSPRPASCWPRWRSPATNPRSAPRQASGRRHLPAHLRGHEPRCLRRGHRRGPQDPLGRDHHLRRPLQYAPGSPWP
jgi:hypothetical protein